jgi:glyceraldehyde-3-phosphate dehydrogenase (NADP+)
VPRFAAAVNGLVAGMPWDAGAAITPLPEDRKPEALAGFVADAVEHGARVINEGGGTTLGTFFQPAVVFPVTPAMKLYSEEQFGPIVPIATWRDEAEIDQFMRHSAYGQQVALFGRDPRRIATLIDALANQICRININSQCRRGPDAFPFSGRKDSAEGTLSITDALRVFSIRTLVATASNDANKTLVGDIVTGRHSHFLSTDFIF